MRLLKLNDSGEFDLTRDFMLSDDIPPYAILSHTWGLDTEEVNFQDMMRWYRQEQAWLCQDPVLRRTSQTRWLEILLDRLVLHRQVKQCRAPGGHQLHVSLVS